jgi:hypothetical protein
MRESALILSTTKHHRGHVGPQSVAAHLTRLQRVGPRFAPHFGRSPAELGPEEMQRQLVPNSLQIAVCALRFLYVVTLKRTWTFEN